MHTDLASGTVQRHVELSTGEYAPQVVIARSQPVRIRDGMSFYASGDGGRLAFNASTDFISLTGTSEQSLAAFRNPAGSGKDVVLWFGEFASTQNTSFRRYRGATITPTGTKRDAANMGGGDAVAVAELYVGGTAATFTGTGGTVSKTALIQAYGQYVANINGSTRLRPGQGIRWTITGGANQGHQAAIYLEWAEIPAMP